jgi:anaerobic magnesium-protoporphyrin IX monomethyl ester cyclase
MARLEENVRRLVKSGRIHLHLDLVAGLPGESFDNFITSIDRVMALEPHHLQIEPVKLLPGSPLRDRAEALRIRFDPNPPYTILASAELSYAELQQLQEISRLLDLTYNSGCFDTFLHELTEATGSFATGLAWLAGEWRRLDLFRFPLSRKEIFNKLTGIIEQRGNDISRQRLLESLAYDYARCERVVTNRIPDFFDTALTDEELHWVKNIVQSRTGEIRGEGVKLQYFAAVFSTLHNAGQRTACLFLYLTQSGKKMQVEEYRFCQDG